MVKRKRISTFISIHLTKPRCTWEEIVGATDYRGYQKYLDGLQNPEDYQENPLYWLLGRVIRYCDKVAALGQQLKLTSVTPI